MDVVLTYARVPDHVHRAEQEIVLITIALVTAEKPYVVVISVSVVITVHAIVPTFVNVVNQLLIVMQEFAIAAVLVTENVSDSVLTSVPLVPDHVKLNVIKTVHVQSVKAVTCRGLTVPVVHVNGEQKAV